MKLFLLVLVCMCVSTHVCVCVCTHVCLSVCLSVSMSIHDYAGVSVWRSKDNFGSSLSSLTLFEAGSAPRASGYSPVYSCHLATEAVGL